MDGSTPRMPIPFHELEGNSFQESKLLRGRPRRRRTAAAATAAQATAEGAAAAATLPSSSC